MVEEIQKFVDKDQSKRIAILEEKCIAIEARLLDLLAKIDVLTNIGKIIGAAVGVALGIDILPMI